MPSQTPRNVHIAEQSLAALRAGSHPMMPMTTRQVAEAIGQKPWEQATWRQLDRLARLRLVTRIRPEYGAAVAWFANAPAESLTSLEADFIAPGPAGGSDG
jgi:hypothetical protein